MKGEQAQPFPLPELVGVGANRRWWTGEVKALFHYCLTPGRGALSHDAHRHCQAVMEVQRPQSLFFTVPVERH